MKNYTIKQFRQDFPDDNACLDYIFNNRYGKNYKCPNCGKTGFYRIKTRKCYGCSWCGYQVYPTADTIFHKSSTKLTDWFYAIYLMSKAKNGISSKELERHLGCSYKTAWRIGQQIRSLMKQDDKKLDGIVEADETYFGGKGHIKGRNLNKIPVMAIVKRGGGVKAKVIPDTQTHTLLGYLAKNVKFGSRLITDDYSAYKKVGRIGLFHDSICHSKKEYVRGEDIFTNTIEGFFGQLKRSIDGTFHCVSKKYLQNYVNEFAYRYSYRFSDASLFYSLLSRLCGQPYSEDGKMPVFEEVKVS